MAWTIAVLLALTHLLLALTAAFEESPTFDEPTHLTAGYSYWIRNDYRLDAENGNLVARWAALPLLLQNLRFPDPFGHPWFHCSAGLTSKQFFFESRNDSDAMLNRARLMMSLFGCALCLVIFCWGRSLFGSVAGLLAEALMVFDPNMLAHSPLVTADVAAALFFTAATWSLWKVLEKLTPLRLTVAALSVVGLFLTKMSAPSFLIVAAGLAIARIFSSQPFAISIGHLRRTISGRLGKCACFAAIAATIGASLYVSIWAAYGFRYSALTQEGRPRDILDARWEYHLQDNPFAGVFTFVRKRHLLPEAFVYGAAYVTKNAQARPSFLDQHWSNVGFRSFFPRAFLYKTPLALFGFLALAVAALVVKARFRRATYSDLSTSASREDETKQRGLMGGLFPVLILIAVYALFALSTRLNIGHRHLLPIYPAIFILCGAGALLLKTRWSNIAIAAIALLGGGELAASFSVRPHYLAYFNETIGGPPNGYQHLVDSSLDWGQDLPSLRQWIDSLPPNRRDNIYLAYFGVASPRHYGIGAHILPEEKAGGALEPLSPGYYCISATILQHVYEKERGPWAQPYERAYQSGLNWASSAEASEVSDSASDAADEKRDEHLRMFRFLRFGRLCAYLRHQKPVGNIGYSILVYRLSENDLKLALHGAPAELSPTIQVALE